MCFVGQEWSAYEQKTQQSLGLGFKILLQAVQR